MAVDRAGRSELHYAALEGRTAEVSSVLADGADPSAADSAGFTPLHFAAQQGQSEAASLLIAAGADVEARNKFGNTPLWVALMNHKTGNGTQVVRDLLAAGASLDARNHSGVSVRDLVERMDLAALIE